MRWCEGLAYPAVMLATLCVGYAAAPRTGAGGAEPGFVTLFDGKIFDDLGKDPDKHSTGAIYDVVTPIWYRNIRLKRL